MAEIWIGPAGICISAKEKSTIGSLKRISELGLSAQEVEFVRGVKMGPDMAKKVGELAKGLNIRLSVHAPYFVNLCSEEKKKLEASKKRILESVKMANLMGADVVVFHPAYYGKFSKEQAYEKVKVACEEIVEEAKKNGWEDVRIGLETTGKKSQFGTLDENIKIAQEVKGCCVIIDWAHIFARNGGKIDFKGIFDKVLELKPKHLHTHFSGIDFTDRGERKHLNLADGAKPDLEPLVKEILKRKVDITLISESPNLEGDAIFLKKIFERGI